MPEVIPRSAFVITLSVWKALLLREALGRLFGRRAAWFWLLLEPLFHVGYLMLIFTVVRVRHVGGIATALWIMIGLVAYFMFQRASRQSMNAVGANFPLFVYRQVLPVDSVVPPAPPVATNASPQPASERASPQRTHGETAEVGLGVVVRPVTTYEVSVDQAFFDIDHAAERAAGLVKHLTSSD